MASIQRIGFSQSQNNLSIIFKALGHPARIAIIETLLNHERIMCKVLTSEVKLSGPTVSKHLQILLDSGLLGYEKISNATYYVVNPMLVDYAKQAMINLSHLSNSKEEDFSQTTFQSSVMPESF